MNTVMDKYYKDGKMNVPLFINDKKEEALRDYKIALTSAGRDLEKAGIDRKESERYVDILLFDTDKNYDEQIRALDNIPTRIVEGKAFIDESLHNEWERCVCIRSTDLYKGRELIEAIEILKALHDGKSIEEVCANINDDFYNLITSIVYTFSDRRNEFKTYLDEKNLAKHNEEEISIL